MFRLRSIVISILLCTTLQAQSSGPEAGVSNKGMAWVVSGLPCTVEYLSTNTRTLSDGTHIVQTVRMRAVRDSQGRVRTEAFPPSTARTKSDEPDFVYVIDPVAQRKFHLSPRMKTATVIEAQIPVLKPSNRLPVESLSSKPTSISPLSHPESTQEAIPGKIFNGLETEGKRTILTIPVGWEGNDQPIRNTTDVYVSPALHIQVFSKSESALIGESIMEITRLDRGEPDPSLFQIPAGYAVTESSPRAR